MAMEDVKRQSGWYGSGSSAQAMTNSPSYTSDMKHSTSLSNRSVRI